MVWRLCVLVAWLAAVVGLAYLDSDDAAVYVWIAPPLTVAVGAVVDRLWAIPTPLVVTLGYLAITGATDSSCASCSDHGNWVAIALMIFTLPAILALGVGVVGRRLFRFMRNLETGADAEPPPAPPRSPPPGPVAP